MARKNPEKDRGSYSKKDSDATFRRMKGDHMRTDSLKTAYNVQVSADLQVSSRNL